MTVRITTRNSVYEVDEKRHRVRRAFRTRPAPPDIRSSVPDNGQWKTYQYAHWAANGRLFITWLDHTTTVTSQVTATESTDDDADGATDD